MCSNGPVDDGLDAVFGRGVDLVAYDLSGMGDAEFDVVLSAVEESGLGHYLSEGEELFVAESDEALIEAIFAEHTDPEELQAQDDDGDGLVAQEVLSEVFAAVDRLKNDGRNADAVLDLLEGADRLAATAPPFGFGPEQWVQLQERVSELRGLLQGDEVDLSAVEDTAAGVRRMLQPIV